MQDLSDSIAWTLASELVARRGCAAERYANERRRKLEQQGDAEHAAVWAQAAMLVSQMIQARNHTQAA